MRRFYIYAIFSLFLFTLLLFTGPALAQPKPWYFGWWPRHWEDLDFEKPYYERGRIHHDHQWDDQDWPPHPAG